MHVVYFDANQDGDKNAQQELAGQDVTMVDGPLHEHIEQAAEAEIVSVFVASEIRVDELDLMPKLKMIATRSTGFDHIDLEACAKREVTVVNVPTYGENTVAEHAFALILALSRKIFQSYERTEELDFDREGLEGFDLKGKTLGVIGCGNIGRHVVKIGRGFDMEVLVSDVHPDEKFAKEIGCEYTETLEELLANSDVITIHVPYIPKATHHLINLENIKKVKKGAVLVNTARGPIVETEAIVWALDERVLSGAGLDVLEGENETMDPVEFLADGKPRNDELAAILRNHMLIARDDVIITPHNGFNSREAKQRIFDTTMENIKAFVKGEPINVVELKQ